MKRIKTKLGSNIPETTRGVLYICEFDHHNLKIKVIAEALFNDAFEALEAYANTPNPESQLASGGTYKDFLTSLDVLHNNMKDKIWLKSFSEQL